MKKYIQKKSNDKTELFFEGKPLNKEFIDFLKIWESNMVLLRLKELSGIKTKKQFQKVDIFSRESEIEDDEFHETENL